ncbi:MAG: beta strand repeat-containing protein [Candidatus Wenzhouxiangella sp. M2_3B_020]
MGTAANHAGTVASGRTARLILGAVLITAGALSAPAAAQPAFSKTFAPSTIGPGSTSLLVFTIDNSGGEAVTGLTFSDNLPADVFLADPAVPTTDCANATLSAPDGGTTITFSDGELAAGAICTVEVLVTSSTVATHMNMSGDLTSSAGNSGPATADLFVDGGLPGFSKSFSPSSVSLGSRSTVTFTIDNTANASNVANLDFTDNLPTGLVVADPANASTDCVSTGAPNTILTADPGTSVVTLDANGSTFAGFEVLAAGASCFVTVDVVPSGLGEFDNVSEDLLADFTAAGRAVDTLESTAGDLVLVKEFLADPVPPGGTVDLEFTILNRTRSADASDVSFTDDLDAALAGLVAVGLPASACGGTLTGTSTLSFTGGTVAAASECAFTVTLQVPAAATPGIYPNTTSNLEADLGFGEPSIGNQASDDLFIFAAPRLEKTFLDAPVAAGASTPMEFTITNTSTTSSATDIAFSDDLAAFLGGVAPPVSSLPASGFCGGSSSIFYNSNTGLLTVSGASLAALDSCTFEVTVDIPAGFPGGIYGNVTSGVGATVDGNAVTGAPASADLEVIGAPRLLKTFAGDAVLPGDTVNLEFTLDHDEFAPADATAIAFTDDLDATLSGLAPLGLPMSDVCGPGSQISVSGGVLSLAGGSLSAGGGCTFTVTLQVPAAAAPGTYPNATSPITATVSGLTTTGNAATDDLLVTGISFAKEFVDDPVIAGGTADLRFTIRNDGTVDATGMSFTDDLDGALPGLAAVGLPANDICGPGSSISGTGFLTFTGGNLAAGTVCTFDVTVDVPSGAADGVYGNVTSPLQATEGGTGVTLPRAADTLSVDSSLLLVSKQFLDEPVTPGDTLTMEIALSNASATNSVTAVALNDDVDAALAGTTVAGTGTDTCGFTAAGIGSGLLELTGGTLAAGGSCSIRVTLQLPSNAGAGLYTNTTSVPTGDVGGLAVTGNAASADFRVINVTFDKTFDGPTTATGTTTLTFTITNNDAATGIGSLAFTDDLEAVVPGLAATGLPLGGICGTGSTISGTSLLTFTGGSLGPGQSCSFDVTLAVPGGTAPGSYVNVTSNLTSAGLFAAPPASANLAVEPPPAFSKVFTPNAIAVGGASTLTFTIDNSGSSLAADALAFSDPLPAGLTVAASPNTASTCGGTVSAAAGSATIGFSGGSVAAGATCTVSVDVAGNTEGSFTNVSGSLTSSSGDSGAASDTIDVVADEFGLTKSFRTAPTVPGGLVEMELSIVNNSTFPLTEIALVDELGAVLSGMAAEGLPLTDVCGPGSEISGTTFVSLTGANLAAGSSCTIVVPVRVPADAAPGSYPNTTSDATATREGVAVTAPAASADLAVSRVTFSKTLAPSVIAAGDSVTATFTVDNPDPANALSDIAFTDDLGAFLPGATATNVPLADACGSGSLVDGASILALSGGSIAAGGNCTFQVVVGTPPGAAPGNHTNRTSALSGTVSGTNFLVPEAEATLEIVPPPSFAKTFVPAVIGIGQVSTLTFTIDNSASSLPADSLAFVDNLPASMRVADPPSAVSTCTGGSISATTGSNSIEYSAGSVAAGTSCSVAVDVVVDAAGTFANTSDPLSSSLGEGGTASAVLEVVPTPGFTKAFSPATIAVGEASTLTFTIDNSASSLPANDLAFVDNLPGSMSVADPANATSTCTGGTIGAAAGASSIAYSGGSLPAGGVCTVTVDVTAGAVATLDNVSEPLTSSLGDSGTAAATMTIGEDSDGVPAAIEAGAPNGGDGNDDGIADGIQNDVASLPTFDGSGFMTVVIQSGCDRLTDVAAFSPSSQAAPPANTAFPFGLVGFRLPCEAAVVDVIFHGAGLSIGGGYFKYGPTVPGDPGTADWYDFAAGGPSTGADYFGDDRWTLTLSDAALGDATGDDGVIIDPGGPFSLSVPVPALDPRLLIALALALLIIGTLATRTRNDRRAPGNPS